MKVKPILVAVLAFAVLSLAACSESSGKSSSEAISTSAAEEISPPPSVPSPEISVESTPEPEPKEIPAGDRVAAITPANVDRIREKKDENEDVVGWLTVPGTDIDSVIVQNPTDDNGFYSKHDFAGTPNRDGTYSADCRCDFTTPTRGGLSQNIALYGHSWDENPNGTLFSQLKRFKDQGFAAAHPYIFFSTEAEDMAYEVFAVYHVTINQPYIIPDLPWASFSEVLELAYDASIFDYGILLTESDKILTLSTCSFAPPGRPPLPFDRIPDYRFVVMARLVSPDDARKKIAAVTLNGDPLPPDAMPAIYSHHADVIQYGGKLYDNLARSHSDKIPEIDPANLIPAGEVIRSGVMQDLQDFDTTKLPAGTPLYLLEGYENLLVAKPGKDTLVYGYGM
jgi:sortase B